MTFDRYFLEWRRRLARFLLLRHRFERDDLDDIMAMVDEKVWRGLERGLFQQGTSEQRWLTAIACNAAIDWKRRRQRDAYHTLTLTDEWAANVRDTAPDPERAAIDREFVRECIAFFEHFPADQRAIVLFTIDGMTPADIATKLGLPLKTVYNRLKSARDKIRGTRRVTIGRPPRAA